MRTIKRFILAAATAVAAFSAPAYAAPDPAVFNFSYTFSSSQLAWTRYEGGTSDKYLFGISSPGTLSGQLLGSNGVITGFTGTYTNPSVSPFSYTVTGVVGNLSGNTVGTYTGGGLAAQLTGLNFKFQLVGVDFKANNVIDPAGFFNLTRSSVRSEFGPPLEDGEPTQFINTTTVLLSSSFTAVPEIDGKMLPQVALLLGSLYMLFVFGRRGAGRRESVSPALAQAA